jgi:hypothetical protein
MKKRMIAVMGAAAVVAASILGGFSLFGDSTSTDQTASGSKDLTLYAQGVAIADGVIVEGEYHNSLYDPQTEMTLYWQNDATTLYVGLVSPGTGWAGVGFSDRAGKPGSNIIVGAVSKGTVTIQDNYGVTKELHLADWTSSILTSGGSEANGQTTLEFSIPLDSGDSQDVALSPGETVNVILAYQATKDSFTSEHTRYSMTEITLD